MPSLPGTRRARRCPCLARPWVWFYDPGDPMDTQVTEVGYQEPAARLLVNVSWSTLPSRRIAAGRSI